MNRILIALAFFLSPFFVFAETDVAYAIQRGRPKIVNHALVAENGSLLRGASGNSFEYDHNNQGYKNLSWWTNVRDDYKLNTIRMFVYCCKPVDSTTVVNLNTLIAHLDVAVANAKKAGMYIILNLYNKSGYNRDVYEKVWATLAPRYKNETHVIYEAFNEPVHWYPSAISQADMQAQLNMYKYIRSRAPNTHIILWSPAHIDNNLVTKVKSTSGINYANAPVGYHPYATSDYNAIGALRSAGYPVIATEMSTIKGSQYIKPYWDYHEAKKISWIFLDLNPGNTYNPTPHPSVWTKQWPADPFYSQ